MSLLEIKTEYPEKLDEFMKTKEGRNYQKKYIRFL